MPRKEEKRISKSISMTPSLWEGIRNLADSRGITASELIISTMSIVVRKHAKTTENFLKAKAEFEKAQADIIAAMIKGD